MRLNSKTKGARLSLARIGSYYWQKMSRRLRLTVNLSVSACRRRASESSSGSPPPKSDKRSVSSMLNSAVRQKARPPAPFVGSGLTRAASSHSLLSPSKP